MKKRNLFAEIAEGFDALAEERAGKRTLRKQEIEVCERCCTTIARMAGRSGMNW
jgi:hypothetical protein